MAGSRSELRRAAEKGFRYFDYNLIVIVLFLLIFGLVMVYSSSSYDAFLTFGNASFYLKKQIIATVVGLAAMIIVALIPYNLFYRVGMLAYLVSLVFIFLIIPFGHEANGAKRWIYISGISFQPAEIAKLAMIVFLACLIRRMGDGIHTWRGFGFVLGMTAIISALLWGVTSNASSAIIVFGIALVMLFVATRDYKRYVIVGVAGAILAALVVIIILANASGVESGNVGGYRGERILAWLDPEAYASGKGFQTLQSLYAIGSGGFFGKGLGESMQKLGFIPEAQNDMIFSVICEELGLFGALALMLLFILLLWRLKIIADNAKDLFGTLIVAGVMGHISIQVILNIAVVTNTIPNTGISLPFISYGGSALVCLMCEMGLALGVAKAIRAREY
ncbi:cell division protein FtsW [Lachnospiraceae bacterium XBB2008]|nr:cell division protein FtsW [Lachnospiraceae bacterium XBB2008]